MFDLLIVALISFELIYEKVSRDEVTYVVDPDVVYINVMTLQVLTDQEAGLRRS
jgi:hypothetical protein